MEDVGRSLRSADMLLEVVEIERRRHRRVLSNYRVRLAFGCDSHGHDYRFVSPPAAAHTATITGSSRLRLRLTRPRLQVRLAFGCDSHGHDYRFVSPSAATHTATKNSRTSLKNSSSRSWWSQWPARSTPTTRALGKWAARPSSAGLPAQRLSLPCSSRVGQATRDHSSSVSRREMSYGGNART